MHLAPRASSVEIYLNSTVSSSAIASGAYSSAYSGLDPGFFTINFKKASTDSLMASIPADYYDSLNFYTLVLYNTLPGNAVQAFAIHDDYSVLSDSKTCYRFFHMSPDIGDVDVYFNSEKWEQGRTYADVAYGGYSQYTQKPGNSYTIAVKKAGTDSVITQTTATFNNQAAYTVFLKGVINGTGNNALGVNVLQALN
jgi:hypothetical protein